MEMLQRRIWTIPDLLWNQADTLRDFSIACGNGLASCPAAIS